MFSVYSVYSRTSNLLLNAKLANYRASRALSSLSLPLSRELRASIQNLNVFVDNGFRVCAVWHSLRTVT